MMNRRTFLGWCGVGTLAGSLPWTIAACTPQNTPSTTGGTSPAGAFAPVGSLTQLDRGGQILAKEGLPKPALVIRDPADTEKLIAVNPTCTHNGCTVEWKSVDNRFVCPCHNAQFNADGSVAQGPATSSLATYETRVEGDQVLVRVS